MEPDTEINIETVKSRSIRGIVIITGRTFFLQILSLIAIGLLGAFLEPFEWGVFAILNAVVNFLSIFSAVGLAAALIQKKDHPTETDLKTTFFIQEVIVVVLVVIILILSPVFRDKFSLNQEGMVLLYALALSFLLSSFKSIPSVLLERKLEFIKLTFPRVLEQLVYYVVLVFFAVRGFGLNAFTIALVSRDVVGLIALYMMQPWRPGIAFSKGTLRDLSRFGVPYQINNFIAAIKDDGKDIVIGTILGPVGFGYLAFVLKFARFPLTFFMDTVSTVAFPTFSRLQGNKVELEKGVTRLIFFVCFLVLPSLVGIVVLAPLILHIIPRYNQWLPALPALLFVAVNFGFAAATTQLTNVLNAIGKIKITFYLMIMWTVLTWVLIPFLSVRFGYDGAALGYALVGSSSVVAILITKRYVNFSVIDSTIKPLIGALLMGLVLIILRGVLTPNFYSLGVLILVGGLVYGAIMISMVGVSLVNDAKKSFKTILSSK